MGQWNLINRIKNIQNYKSKPKFRKLKLAKFLQTNMFCIKILRNHLDSRICRNVNLMLIGNNGVIKGS